MLNFAGYWRFRLCLIIILAERPPLLGVGLHQVLPQRPVLCFSHPASTRQSAHLIGDLTLRFSVRGRHSRTLRPHKSSVLRGTLSAHCHLSLVTFAYIEISCLCLNRTFSVTQSRMPRKQTRLKRVSR